MSLSPLDSAGLLWQVACTALGAVFASPSVRNAADQPGAHKQAPKTAPRRHPNSAKAHAALVVVPPADRITGTFTYRVVKRVFDVVAGAVCLAAVAPLMVAVAVGIASTLGRPSLFSQQRVGRGGRLFRLYKFRTLERRPLACSEVEWAAAASHPFAAFLRRSGLDELPQLIHVLLGQMSLVGPRPERPHFVEAFERQMPHYAARHHLRAGITGWAQIHGLRGDTSIRRRLDHDLFYLKHWSLGLDLRILALTARGLGAGFGRRARGQRFDAGAIL
jgi:lipopolysaccharide/colanic/teichoic acid biosynthesis glycosyltransferase